MWLCFSDELSIDSFASADKNNAIFFVLVLVLALRLCHSWLEPAKPRRQPFFFVETIVRLGGGIPAALGVTVQVLINKIVK